MRPTAEVLALRARQLERRDEDLEEAILHLQRVRTEGKIILTRSVGSGKQSSMKEIQFYYMILEGFKAREGTNKLGYRWLGPYQISVANSLKGTYILAELDGTLLSGTIAGNMFKKFFACSGTEARSELESEPELTNRE